MRRHGRRCSAAAPLLLLLLPSSLLSHTGARGCRVCRCCWIVAAACLSKHAAASYSVGAAAAQNGESPFELAESEAALRAIRDRDFLLYPATPAVVRFLRPSSSPPLSVSLVRDDSAAAALSMPRVSIIREVLISRYMPRTRGLILPLSMPLTQHPAHPDTYPFAAGAAAVPRDVAAVLLSLGLSEFGPSLVSAPLGVESAADILALSEQHLTAIGMTVVKANKLLRVRFSGRLPRRRRRWGATLRPRALRAAAAPATRSHSPGDVCGSSACC